MPIETAHLLVFLTAALMLNLTPRNDMMFVLGQSLKGGARMGIAASPGIATGLLVHLALVALGVAMLLAEYPAVFELIRYAGAAYLLWIAWRTLASPVAAMGNGSVRHTVFAAWRDGALVNVFNPKIIVFIFAFLPPFIQPENGSPLLQLLIFGMIFNVGGTLVNFAVAASAARIGAKLSADARVGRWFARASAGLFVILAARMTFERR